MIMSRHYVTVHHICCYGLYLSRDINLQGELWFAPHPFLSHRPIHACGWYWVCLYSSVFMIKQTQENGERFMCVAYNRHLNQQGKYNSPKTF